LDLMGELFDKITLETAEVIRKGDKANQRRSRGSCQKSPVRQKELLFHSFN